MACRSKSKTDEAIKKMKEDNPTVDLKLTFMECDLASLASVRKFAQEFTSKKLPIHILMNNAGKTFATFAFISQCLLVQTLGIMAIPEFTQSTDGIELQLAANHFGHFYLTSLLLPILKSTAKSLPDGAPSVRVVNLSSFGHNFTTANGIEFEDYNNPTSKFSECLYFLTWLNSVTL
jgi:NAD(P)-dependent dehydrogenase (short-subunit alcohol dehydrogenase family)